MYGAYIFLTNAVPARTVLTRVLVLFAMGGFFIMALAIPDTFGDSGLAFGFAYLFVVLVHAGMFLLGEGGSPGGIVRIAPGNLLGAALVLAAARSEGTAEMAFWAAAVALMFALPFLAGTSEFRIKPAHFVERHGLVIIVALGESVIALGIGAEGQPVGWRLVVAAGLGLTLVAALWWAWFEGEDERAEVALADEPEERRARIAVYAFGYSFIPLLMGIVLVAAGAEEAIAHPQAPLTTAGAWFLAGGVAAFLVGDVCFRVSLGLRPLVPRVVAAGLALLTVPVGTELDGKAQMGVLVLVLVGLAVAGDRSRQTLRHLDRAERED
jgi:low temperature requirement protein LtrA